MGYYNKYYDLQQPRFPLLNIFASIKSLFNNKCYRQGGQSSDRFSLVMRELWGSITTEERAEICRRMADER